MPEPLLQTVNLKPENVETQNPEYLSGNQESNLQNLDSENRDFTKQENVET